MKQEEKKERENKPWFVAFVDFSSINTVMTAYFKLPKI